MKRWKHTATQKQHGQHNNKPHPGVRGELVLSPADSESKGALPEGGGRGESEAQGGGEGQGGLLWYAQDL